MRSSLFVVAGLLFAAPAAFADSYAVQQARPRVGLELGIGLQAGEVGCRSQGDFCEGFTEAGGLNLNASYFLTPGLGIGLDLWGMSHYEGNFSFNHYVNTFGIKLRPVRFLTLSAGVGMAHATIAYEDEMYSAAARSESAPAVMGAISLDLIRGNRWALSLEARVGKGFYGGDSDTGTPDVVGQNNGLGATFTFFRF